MIDYYHFIVSLIFIGCVAFFSTCYFIIPFVKKVALAYGVIDDPKKSTRKIHKRTVPYLGGAAIYIGFLSTIVIYYVFLRRLHSSIEYPEWFLAYLAGGALVLILGTLDDVYDISALKKLLTQIGIACLTYIAGIQIDHLNLPIVGLIELGPVSFVFTIFIITVLMNAINIIDGMDGLASGVVLVATSANLVLALHLELYLTAIIAAILVATLLAFIRHNWHPATIFLGDGGSLLISYLLTVIMIQNVQAANKASQVFLPVLVLFYPFIDIVFAMARRFLRGKPVMSADKAHLHHFLMQVGISHEGCVKLVILFSAGLSIVAIFLIYDLVVYGLILLTLLLVLLAIFFIITGYFEPKLLNRYLQHRPILKTLNSYKNFTLTKIKYVSSADEMWQIILDVAKEYKFKGLIWKAGSGEKKMFGDTTEVPTFHKESMFFSGGEVLYKTDNELDEDVRSEIESVVKVIVIALDKRVKSLDN